MGDGVPHKKRWKIDFSSVCNKNVVSFAKATGVNTSSVEKSDENLKQDNSRTSSVGAIDFPAQELNGSESDQSNELDASTHSISVSEAKVTGDFSNEKYKPLEDVDDEEELDYNELDEDVIHRTKYLGLGDIVSMGSGRKTEEDFYPEEDEEDTSFEKDEVTDQAKAGVVEPQNESSFEEHSERVSPVFKKHVEEKPSFDSKLRETEQLEKESSFEEEQLEQKSSFEADDDFVIDEGGMKDESLIMEHESGDEDEQCEGKDVDEEKMKEEPVTEFSKYLEPLATEEVDNNREICEAVKSEGKSTENPNEDDNSSPSKVKLFEPLNPHETDSKGEAENTPASPFLMSITDLDINDPSSPPLVVSKPSDMKPQVRTRVTKKKKKVMVTIQTYNSGSEEEPEVKVRPQRRSKPSMMDLRDQHRIFNTTSFIKENIAEDSVTRPETYHPASVPTQGAQVQALSPPQSISDEVPLQPRMLTSSSDDTEDGMTLSQFVPKKVSADKDDDKEDKKQLKKVKKRKLKKKKRDPEEPQKPVSAYALFFRDRQSSIKAKKPDASFGEISKIVANEWDALDGQKKADYKKKTESAKKDYLKRLAAYKANKISSEPFPEAIQEADPVPVAAVPPGFVPSTPVISGHLYTAQQSESSPASHGNVHFVKEQSHEPPRDPRHYSTGNSRSDYVSETSRQDHYQPSVLPTKPGICVNEGCTNLAIEDNRWDREYCSTECVVQHCRDAFQSWVMQRQDCFNDSTTAIY